ncbi:MAG: hypothetical protein AB7Y46_19875 [Armatimonadota bacterium]
MSNTTRTLVVLVACLALSVPVWADYGQGCPCECRNGNFTWDMTDYTGIDYDGTGISGATDGNVDHWTLSDLVWDTAFGHAAVGSIRLDGLAGTVWQVVDETVGGWEWLGAPTGWANTPNNCWNPKGIRKQMTVSYWKYFTRDSNNRQSISVKGYGWTGAVAPGAFDPGAPGANWELAFEDTVLATSTNLNTWGQTTHTFELMFQPRYMAWVWTLTDPLGDDGPPPTQVWLDEVRIYGECKGSQDAPELGTWLLLACTGAAGGFLRRRRRS